MYTAPADENSIKVSDQMYKQLNEFYQESEYAKYEQSHRQGGTLDVKAIKVDKDPYQSSAPGFDEWIFSYCKSDVQQSKIDFGFGVKTYSEKRAGTLCVIPPNVAVDCESSCAVTLNLVSVPASNMHNLIADCGLTEKDFEPVAGEIDHVAGAGQVIESLWNASERNGASASLFVDACLMQLVALVTQRFTEDFDTKGLDAKRITRTLEYIDASLGKTFTVAELASINSMSVSQFSRRFKVSMNKSVWNYVQEKRLSRAKHALMFTDEPIYSIALNCGFSDQAHLSSSLKNAEGTTPGKLRGKK